MSPVAKLRTYLDLGPRSLARVGAYRLGLRAGLHPVQRLAEPAPTRGPFFRAAKRAGDWPEPDRRWLTHAVRFDWHVEPLPDNGIPDWFANPFGQHGAAQAVKPWWTISDFAGGDIKGLWELSRFGWLPPLAALALRGEEDGDRLNGWIADWCATNPPYRGPNWKCGQEASIRVMHLACAAVMLEEDKAPLSGLVDLIGQHCARIAPTMSYAIGQNNNHGTSEAAALFIGGSLLVIAGDARGERWSAAGRRWLDERASRLIEAKDGGFSQYSITYHRVMLDTYSLAELWRRRHDLSPFAETTTGRLQAASEWLRAMVDEKSGDAPNIGASDGARLLPLTPTGYRDFRPSVQLATALFHDRRAYPPGPWDDALRWMHLLPPDWQAPAPTSRSFDEGGWHVLRRGRCRAVMRYPRFRFRPSHADALHVELMVDGARLLRDAGTYSYNDPAMPDGDFAGTAFHNSVCFDDRDQMPRLSRFLFGSWIKAEGVVTVLGTETETAAAASYRDGRGNLHARRIELHDLALVCVDRISGGFNQAVLRWRLPVSTWTMENNVAHAPDGTAIQVDADCALQLRLVSGLEANRYGVTEEVSVLEAMMDDSPCSVTTTVRWPDAASANAASAARPATAETGRHG